jgi:hypothetical protein
MMYYGAQGRGPPLHRIVKQVVPGVVGVSDTRDALRERLSLLRVPSRPVLPAPVPLTKRRRRGGLGIPPASGMH